MSRVVRRWLRIEWRVLTVAIVATLAGSAVYAFGPTMIRAAIDDGIRDGDRDALTTAVVTYLVLQVVAGLAGGVRTLAAITGAERFVHRLRLDALRGVLRMDLGAFERARRGDLLARVTADTEALSSAARWVLPDSIRHLADLVASIVAVALLDPVLALLALIAAPAMLAAGRRLKRRSAIVYPRHRESVGALVGEMTETIEGTDAVRAFGRERDRLDALAAANRDVTARYLDGTNMRIQFYSSITVIRTTATAIVVIVASLLAVDGRLSVGTAAAGALAVSSVFGPLAWFTELLDDLLSARAALERVVGAAQLAATSTGTATLPARGDVVFEGVSFSYVPGRPVLDGVDLHVPSGARVALVGETGAGKSTIARLAAGLATPTAGAVRVGGVDLRDASEDARRARLLFVLQETLCTSGTIADNLRLVAPDATDAELLDAARRVGADAWLSAHDDGLGRDVGVGGSHLSVGERQLVTAMRVALADPAVVILDEATASLDPELEDLVGRALDRALGDRTVLVIAHRPTTAARCDQVVLVEHGRVQPVTARS